MSLTSFLKIPEIRDRFKTDFPLKSTKLEGEIKAKPLTTNFQLVGTAFDYLFRFYLEQKNPTCLTRRWVAESSVLLLEKMRKGGKYHKQMKLLLEESKKSHACFLSTGKMDDKIIKTSIILAQMDLFCRIGMIYPNLGDVEKGDIKDLRNLISLVDPKLFIAKKYCFLNPTFGSGSKIVGGADADLIIDDTLIDIKTTKHLSFTQDNFNQLIGYYILSKLGKVNESKNVPLHNVGIYFSRHGILHTIAVKQIENHKNFPKFVKWFKEQAEFEQKFKEDFTF